VSGARDSDGSDDTGQLRLLVDSVIDYAIFLLRIDGTVATWNPGAQILKGYTADEIVGQHFSRFYTEWDRQRKHPDEELRIAEREGRFEEEGWRVRKDGTQFWARVVITALRQHGELVGFGKVTQDLTERRRAEEALREQTHALQRVNEDLSRFRRLVSGVTDYAIFLLEPDGTVATWNAGAENIKGYLADEIVGQHFSTFYTEEDRARSHPEEELRIAEREGRFEEEGWRLRKDGTRFWANVVLGALRDDTGRLVGFSKVTRDLTERRAAAQRLEDAHHELQQASEEMRLFSSAAAHDLREPLRTLAGFTDILNRRYADDLPAPARELLGHVSASVERMQELIDSLLAFARSGARELEPQSVGLRDMIGRALTGLGAAISAQGAEVGVEVPEDAVLRADRVFVEVVVQNLVENAVKFAEPGEGQIVVGAERRGAVWRVFVRDNGPGIDPKDQEAVFEPFRRLHGRGEYSGSGLGLATCRRAIERQGGVMGLDSALGAGATFWFELPVA
jgi:PAS domain S-box-containing protein